LIHNDSTETDEETKLDSNDEVDNRQELNHKRIIRKPKYLSEYEIYNAFCLMMSHEEPETFCKAIQDKSWNEAIQNELKSHQELETWTETELPEGITPIETKWVFRIKENGTKKVRLVAKGFQIQEESYTEPMYAPVGSCRSRFSTVRPKN